MTKEELHEILEALKPAPRERPPVNNTTLLFLLGSLFISLLTYTYITENNNLQNSIGQLGKSIDSLQISLQDQQKTASTIVIPQIAKNTSTLADAVMDINTLNTRITQLDTNIAGIKTDVAELKLQQKYK